MISEEEVLSDPALMQYYSLRPSSFRHVEQLVLRQSDEFGSFGYIGFLDMVLASADAVDPRCLHLTFSGVLNLRLTPPIRRVIHMGSLEISLVRDLGWEGVNYKVQETDDDTLSFLCRYFSAEVTGMR